MSTVMRVLAVMLVLLVPAGAMADNGLKKFTDVLNALTKKPGGPAGNLIVNGGFEEPVVRQGGYVTYQPGQSFAGWQVIGPPGGVSPISGAYASSGVRFVAREGQQWLDMTGPGATTGAGVQQAVQTTPGQVYDLAFWVGNVSAGGFGTVSTIEVLVDGRSLGLARNDQTIKGQQGWGLFKMQVTATGNTTTLAFVNRDPSNDNSNGLDAVSLVPAKVDDAAATPGAATAPAAAPGGTTELSAETTSAAFQAAGFRNSGGQWRSGCDDPGTPSYSPGSIDKVADLNGDGRPEAVIIEGGTYCYGMTGQGYWLVSQRADGRWQLLDSGTGLLAVLATKGTDGWPDLEIGGPSFCFSVRRWNGSQYQHQRWQYDGKPCKAPG